MPPELKCPFCALIVPDWHFEWHTKEDQADVFLGKKTMACPYCHAGVAFDGFAVSKVELPGDVAMRDVVKATRWARVQSKSLRDYLETREGEPYVGVWTDAEIDAADKLVASEGA